MWHSSAVNPLPLCTYTSLQLNPCIVESRHKLEPKVSLVDCYKVTVWISTNVPQVKHNVFLFLWSLLSGSKVSVSDNFGIYLVPLQISTFLSQFSITQKWQSQLKGESRLLFLARLTLSLIIKSKLPGMVFSFTFPSWQTSQPLLAWSDFISAAQAP